MARYVAEIKTLPKHFKVLHSATVIFEASDLEEANEQAQAYADRLGSYDACEVDSLYELA